MENSVIAVQLADGTFVPVLNTTSSKRRRLVVTTVRDNQENVKIELFRGSDESMGDAEYVGSLVIDNVEPAASGTPDISVLLGVDESGNLNATATDTKSGEYQSLSVSLEQLDEEGGYDMPDFQLSDEELTLDDLSLDEEDLDEDVEDEAAGEITDEDELEADLTDELDTLEPAEQESPLEADLGDSADEATEPAAAAEPAATGEPDDASMSLDDLSFDESEDTSAEVSSDEMNLDDLSFDEPDDELGLDDLSLDDEAPAGAAEEPAPADELSLGEAEELAPPPAGEETDELDELDELDEPDDLEDVSLEDISFDEDLGESLEESSDLDTSSADPVSADATSTEESTESADAFGDLADEEFSFDESLTMESGFEGEGEETVTSVGEEEFDLGSLTEEESGDEFEDPSTDFDTASDSSSESSDDEFSLDTDLGDGMIEADLGDEDFTFDEGGEDEPLFPEPAELSEGSDETDDELEDTLSPEEFERLDSEPVSAAAPEPMEADEPIAPRTSNAIIFIGYMILALAALGVLTYLVFRLMEGPPAPPLRAQVARFVSFAAFVPGVVRRRTRRGPRREARRG